jgi:hypothetical protein
VPPSKNHLYIEILSVPGNLHGANGDRTHPLLILAPQPDSLLLERLLSEERVVDHIRPQPVRTAQVGLEIPDPAEDRSRAVEYPAGLEGCLSQFIGSHVFWLESGVVEAVIGMQPPLAVEKQAALVGKLTIEPGSWVRQ